MSLIQEESCECSTSSLELFTMLPTNTSVEKSSNVEFDSLTSVRDGAAIEFYVPASVEEYIDLQNTKLSIKCKITQADGTALGANDIVTPINNLFDSLFSNVEVFMNDRLISHSNNSHGYTSYINHLIHDSEESMKSERSMRLIYKDTPNQMDVTEARLANTANLIPGFDVVKVDGEDEEADPVFEALGLEEFVGNNGLYRRFVQTQGGRYIQMLGRLRIDLFEQERYLPNGISMKLRFHRQKDRFCLMSAADNYKIQIESAYLLLRKIKPSPGVIISHAETLLRTPAKYPITRKDCKIIAVPAGMQSMKRDNIFLGQLPKRVVVGMVDGAAFAGVHNRNPYNFQHFKFNYMQLLSDGTPVRSHPLKPDLEHGYYIHCYETLYRGLNKMDGERSSIIKLEDWDKGYALTAFDLTPDMDSGDRHALIKHGNLRLEIEFAEALPSTINVIVYAEFDNVLEITSERNINFDYV